MEAGVHGASKIFPFIPRSLFQILAQVGKAGNELEEDRRQHHIH